MYQAWTVGPTGTGDGVVSTGSSQPREGDLSVSLRDGCGWRLALVAGRRVLHYYKLFLAVKGALLGQKKKISMGSDSAVASS